MDIDNDIQLTSPDQFEGQFMLRGEGGVVHSDTRAGTWLYRNHSDPDTVRFAGPVEWQRGLILEDFGVEHTGTGAALVLKDNIQARLKNIRIECSGGGQDGIRLEDSAFFNTGENIWLSAFKGIGVDIGVGSAAEGFGHSIRNSTIVSGQGEIGVRIQRQHARIEYSQVNCTNGTGVQFWNPETHALHGGTANGLSVEVGTGVEIDGDTHQFRDVTVENSYFLHKAGTKGVVFGRAKDCALINPAVVTPGTDAILAEWLATSTNCRVECSPHAARAKIRVEAGAKNPSATIQGLTTETERNSAFQGEGSELLTVFARDEEGRLLIRRNDVWAHELSGMIYTAEVA